MLVLNLNGHNILFGLAHKRLVVVVVEHSSNGCYCRFFESFCYTCMIFAFTGIVHITLPLKCDGIAALDTVICYIIFSL